MNLSQSSVRNLGKNAQALEREAQTVLGRLKFKYSALGLLRYTGVASANLADALRTRNG